ncbi:hypothetical protein TNCV_4385981 [Trichonephila clavipes]|nr:hypothetical protein TNCV_4385981 [Trichonephila clavipes]
MRNPSPCNGNEIQGYNNETIIFPGKFNLPPSLPDNRSRNSSRHRSSIGKKIPQILHPAKPQLTHSKGGLLCNWATLHTYQRTERE